MLNILKEIYPSMKMEGDVFSLFLQSLVDYPARTQSWPMSRLLGDLYCCCIALH